jgi:hypothetical protein
MAFSTYAEAATNFRRYLNDSPQLNTLDRAIESTDDELIDFIQQALTEINFAYEPKTMFALEDVAVIPGVDQGRVSWSMLRTGALLQLLTIKGVISSRNAITYSDAGGVNVTEMDKWGRYLNYFNVLANKYERQVQALKVRSNIESVYGGVNSPMGWDYYYG